MLHEWGIASELTGEYEFDNEVRRTELGKKKPISFSIASGFDSFGQQAPGITRKMMARWLGLARSRLAGQR